MNIFIQRALFIKDLQKTYKGISRGYIKNKGLTKDLSRIYVGKLDQGFFWRIRSGIYIGEIDHIYYNKHDIQLSC